MTRLNFKTQGTCSKMIIVDVQGDTVQDVVFMGGCQGNSLGIRSLVKGMTVQEVISKLDGIPCGNKGTSCPDQLAKCLKEYVEKNGAQ